MKRGWGWAASMEVVLGVDASRFEMVCLLLFYAIGTVFQLCHYGSDIMQEMTRRKPEPTLELTQGIFNLPHFIGMV